MPLDHDAIWAATLEELEPTPDRQLSSRTLSEVCTRVLRGVLRSGAVKPGEKLPSEPELGEIFRVSRATIREALRTLERERLISRRRGIGTVVLPELIRKDLSLNFGITTMMLNAGQHEKIEEIEVGTEEAEEVVASALRLEMGDKVLKLDRVRVVEERPIVWSVDWLPGELLPYKTLERFALGEFGSTSLYDFLKYEVSRPVVRGIADLRAILATSNIANKLRIRRGRAVMEMTQTDFDRMDQPVLHSVEYHLPEAVQFHIQRLGPFT